ncbi:MAG: helix-turn-helix domain-containing protein [Solirubrobacteraceae bacterium]|nr:helix-turn-helix domain-containing protein [Solirubrobacteraceae bacterium]
MAEIGAALREARTRARIEIAQMETQTKIRAKYLRALENEEWELLPGPTYVKSFLKTYGDMLGLEGRQLVADYKREHEPFQVEGDIGQLSKHSGGRMNRQQGRPPLVRTVAFGLLAAVVLGAGAYFFLLRGEDEPAQVGTEQPIVPIPDATTPVEEDDEPEAPRRAAVSVMATGDVSVCMRVGRDIVVPERDGELRAGERTKTATGRTVIVTVTSPSRALRLRVNGRNRALPDAPAGPLTVSVTATGVKRAGATISACRV